MPDKVKIDTVTYNIVTTAETIIVDGRECRGSIDYDNNLIKIAEWLGKGQTKVTLAHEIIHGIVFERGLDLKTSDNETIVDELGKGLIEIIRDNPILIDYFKTSD